VPVSISAGVDQCQSLKQPSQVEKLKADGLGATEIANG
jgi:hypothetical protein